MDTAQAVEFHRRDIALTNRAHDRQRPGAMVIASTKETTMANEKNRPPQHPGQNDAPPKRGPTEQPETDSSGDALDDTGEDNKQKS
jgi:hypothetical protein